MASYYLKYNCKETKFITEIKELLYKIPVTDDLSQIKQEIENYVEYLNLEL